MHICVAAYFLKKSQPNPNIFSPLSSLSIPPLSLHPHQGGDYEEWELDDLMLTFFAIFYVDDAYLASRDAEFLQRALDLLVSLFARVGLETNMSETQTMICILGRIRTQLPADSYRRLRRGRVTAAEWNARDVECFKCGKMVKATSLRHHLADMHNVYQQTVVAEEMLICRPAKTYIVSELSPAGLSCPFPECDGFLKSGWMMRRHFWARLRTRGSFVGAGDAGCR
jgi:hypothetical protein